MNLINSVNSKKYGSIYKITNQINNKIYIGQTIGPINTRLRSHTHGTRKTSAINMAIRKYGIKNFIMEEILIAFDGETLDYCEEYFILLFSSLSPDGYNIKHGGANGRHHVSTKEAIGRANRIVRGSRIVVSLNLITNSERSHPSIGQTARDLGMNGHTSVIAKILHKKPSSYTFHGHTFRFIDEPYPDLTSLLLFDTMNRPVSCKDIKTGEEMHFESTTQAATFFSTIPNNIASAIRQKRVQSFAGKLWKYSDAPNYINKRVKISHRRRKIVALNKEDNTVYKIYDFIMQAAQDGFDPSVLPAVCKGKRNSHGGYRWMYYDEYLRIPPSQLNHSLLEKMNDPSAP